MKSRAPSDVGRTSLPRIALWIMLKSLHAGGAEVSSRRRVMTRHSHRALPETVSAHLSPSFEIVVVPYSWVLRNSKLHTRVSVKKSALGRRKVPTSSSLFFCLLH